MDRGRYRSVLSIGFVLMVQLVAADGLACSCSGASAEEAYGRADAVVQGHVSDVDRGYIRFVHCALRFWMARYVNISVPKPEDMDFACGTRATIQVEYQWKGEPDDELLVVTGRGHGDCGFPFQADKRYLLYLYRSDEAFYTTDICSGSLPIEMAGEDIAFLHGLSA